MLKTIPPTTNCDCGYFKSKCAEIHYQKTSFSIICIFCGVKTLDYQDFVEHFRKLHFNDFSNTIQSMAEPGAPFFENDKAYNDPLEFGERSDSDEVMEKLKEESLEVKAVKIECSEKETLNGFKVDPSVSGHDEILSNCSRVTDDHAEFEGSDNEYITCEIKVEQSDLKSANPTKPAEVERRINYPTQQLECVSGNFEYEEEENYFYPLVMNGITDTERAMDMENQEHSDDDDDVKHEKSIEDIDWSKSFEPNLLRNHEKRPYKPRNKPNLCTYCGRTFKRRYQLETHLNVHTGDKPHQCEICGRLFRAITTLTRHLNTHEKRQMLFCKFCKKAFTHKVALLSHELRHTQQRKVPCDECDKWFYTVNQMDTHKRKVHKSDQDDLPFVCDICSKRYRSGSMLSTHKFKKHYKTAKFSCEQCGKKFVNEQQLHVHRRIHVNKE